MTFCGSKIVVRQPAMSIETGEDGKEERGPLRRCFVSGERLPKAGLLRFVIDPSGVVVFDVMEQLPGRGLWLKAERDMIDNAASKRSFSKAARRSVDVPDDLANMVAAGLKHRCLDRLGLARKAGLVVVGFEQVRAHIGAGRAALLLEAADGSVDGRRKVTGLAPHLPVIELFTGAELGRTLGRDHAVHVALSAGGLTDALQSDAGRYGGVSPPVLRDEED